MADGTGIEWTDATWNPLRGCSRVSEGCRNCYAETVAARFNGPGLPYEGLTKQVGGEHRWTGDVRLVESALDQPLRWKRPRRIFVNSMSDLFHENVPDEWIDRIFAVMALAPQHTFQILTKRPERMHDYMISSRAIEWKSPIQLDKGRAEWTPMPLPNVWLGVSVEDQRTAEERIPLLLATPAAKRFISDEPLLGPVDLTDLTIRIRPGEQPCGLAGLDALTGIHWDAEDTIVGIYGLPDPRIDWVICGGESGPHARPMHPDWARGLRDQCADAGVPFFFKQWGEWAPNTIIDQWRLGKRGVLMKSDGSKPTESDLPAFMDGTFDYSGWLQMSFVGKRAAGSLLDGREHKEFPA